MVPASRILTPTAFRHLTVIHFLEESTMTSVLSNGLLAFLSSLRSAMDILITDISVRSALKCRMRMWVCWTGGEIQAMPIRCFLRLQQFPDRIYPTRMVFIMGCQM